MTKTKFLLKIRCNNKQTSDKNKEKYSRGDYKLMQYQILQTNITRTTWQTVKRITNDILGVKGLGTSNYSSPGVGGAGAGGSHGQGSRSFVNLRYQAQPYPAIAYICFTNSLLMVILVPPFTISSYLKINRLKYLSYSYLNCKFSVTKDGIFKQNYSDSPFLVYCCL